MKKINNKLLDNYQPSEDEEYMNEMQLAYFQKKLLLWKKSLMQESKKTIENLRNQRKLNGSDVNDRAKTESDINVELRIKDRYRKLTSKINAALQRIQSGRYGFCVRNFEPIGLKRLEVRPIATLSLKAQEEHERTEKIYSGSVEKRRKVERKLIL